MRFVLVVIFQTILVLASPQDSTPDGGRRFQYPQENFSIAVPAAWSEIESAMLAAMAAAMHQAAPSAPELKIRHAFKASSTYPWVAITFTVGRVDEAMFENMDLSNRTVDELIKIWESSGGTLEKAQMNSMSYDKARHLLWGMSRSTFSGVGELQTLSGAYVTTTGSIQVHCYSKASEFGKYKPICKDIIESVVIDPKIVISVKPAK
jgi:hypothetical protein